MRAGSVHNVEDCLAVFVIVRDACGRHTSVEARPANASYREPPCGSSPIRGRFRVRQPFVWLCPDARDQGDNVSKLTAVEGSNMFESATTEKSPLGLEPSFCSTKCDCAPHDSGHI